MRAVLLARGQPLSPFGDPVGEARVLDRPLEEARAEALELAGAAPPERGDAAPTAAGAQSSLLVTDDLWLTPELARAFAQAARRRGTPAVLALPEGLLTDYSAALQDLGEAEVEGVACRLYPLAWLPPGEVWDEAVDPALEPGPLEPLVIDPDPMPLEVPVHTALAPEGRLVLPVTHLAAVRVGHWLHLLRANHLAQLGWGSRLLRTSPLRLLWAVLRARSLNRYRVMDKLTQRGRGCDVHPSAVVEASVLGRDVRVGAHSLVRFSHLGDGVHVAEHAHVSESVLGAGSAVSRMGVLKGCVLYPGANTGHYGIQLSVVGRDAFLGGEVLLGDFKPSGDVRVRHRGEVVSAGTRLLGCAVGHRCRLFMRATVYPGREIPNDLTILGPTRDAISRVPEDLPTDVALTSEDGVLRPLGGEGEVP